MFERFTDRARRVVVQAQAEARELRHNYIGTEHLLLGLVTLDEGLAIEVLRALNVDTGALAGQVKNRVGQAGESVTVSERIPFTPAAKKTLELSLREALQLKHDFIGTEHLLLAMLYQGEGAAYEVLYANGVDREAVRAEVIRLLGEHGKPPGEPGRITPVRRTTVHMPGGTDRIPDIDFQLAAISRRLAAIEARLGIEPSAGGQRVRQLDLSLARVRRDKVTAIDDKDFERAAALRDQEKRLLTERRDAQLAWLAEEAGEEDTTE
jgi:hypothetical protein